MLIDAWFQYVLETGQGKLITWKEQDMHALATMWFMDPKPFGVAQEWEQRKCAKQPWVKYMQLEASLRGRGKWESCE